MKKMLKSLLPGIFLFGFTVGTGSVTAMAKAGADYGMTLLWALFLSCAITFFLLDLFGRYTLVTGQTALQSFRKYIHPYVAIFFIVALTAHVCGSVMGVMGILADFCFEWSKNYIDGGIPAIVFAIFFVAVIYVIFLVGKISVFQNVLALLVAIMALCFLLNFFLFMPAASDILAGMIPRIPYETKDNNAFLIVASMVGTTVFSGLFILRTILVKHAGWTSEDTKIQRKDALFSGFLMFLVSMAIMGAAAGTLYVDGITLEKVSAMVRLLEPLAGSFAVIIFSIGLIAAGLSSQFPNVALLPWLLDDYHERKNDLTRFDYRLLVLAISLLGLIVPIFNTKPIVIMIASQAFGAIILPATVLAIFYLGNREDIMGVKIFNKKTNIFLTLILLFAITMSSIGLIGVFATLRSL